MKSLRNGYGAADKAEWLKLMYSLVIIGRVYLDEVCSLENAQKLFHVKNCRHLGENRLW